MPLATGAASVTSLGLLLGAVGLAGWWAQSRRRSTATMVHRTVTLGHQQALHVVEIEGRRLLVGTGPGAAPRLLTELWPQPDEQRVDAS